MVSDAKSSVTWTEYKNDLFDDYGGMESGSHSLTLGRLYAWEKKLYEEVKVSWFRDSFSFKFIFFVWIVIRLSIKYQSFLLCVTFGFYVHSGVI